MFCRQERSTSCRGLVVRARDGRRARQQWSPGAPLRGRAGLPGLRAAAGKHYARRVVSIFYTLGSSLILTALRGMGTIPSERKNSNFI